MPPQHAGSGGGRNRAVYAVGVHPRPKRRRCAEPHTDFRCENESLDEQVVVDVVGSTVKDDGQDVRGWVRRGDRWQSMPFGVERSSRVGVEPGCRTAKGDERPKRQVGLRQSRAFEEDSHRPHCGIPSAAHHRSRGVQQEEPAKVFHLRRDGGLPALDDELGEPLNALGESVNPIRH